MAGCKVGQKPVIRVMPAILLREESDCPPCIKAIGSTAELIQQLWDRMSDGLEANEGRAQVASCLDQGIKHGGLGNVRFKIRVEKRS